MKTVMIPGSPVADQPAPRAPKSGAPGMQLCVDCGNSFATTEMMQHDTQAVCYSCYHKRKSSVEADAAARASAPARKAGKRRKILLLVIAAVVLAAAAVAAWLSLR
jgi:hypothetical protein